MVSPELSAKFASEGIKTLSEKKGCQLFLQEICSGDPSMPAVIIGEEPLSFSKLMKDPDSDHLPDPEIFVDASTHPYLESHTINDRVVIPMVMVNEWIHRLSSRLYPGFPFCEVRDLRVFKGLIVGDYFGKGNLFRISAALQESDDLEVKMLFTIKNAEGQLCYTARVSVKKEDTIALPDDVSKIPAEQARTVEPQYGGSLFHGPDFQVIRGLEQLDKAGGAAVLNGLQKMAWKSEDWQTDPAVFDGGLQLAVLWSEKVLGGSSLPTEISRVRSWVRKPATGPVRCFLKARGVKSSSAVSDMYFVDQDHQLVAALEGVETHLRPDSMASQQGRG